jgi:GTP cyclohydrolase II
MTERVLSPILSELYLRLDATERRRARTRPFVTLAYAQSLDGSIAGEGNRPLALSCKRSLTLTHELRAAHDAILVGIGTVLADDPRLNVRLVSGTDPVPIVVDSRLRIPPDAQLLARKGVLIATADSAESGPRSGEGGPAGAEVLPMPALANGWVDLENLLRHLLTRGVRHVLVEGGARILKSFLEERLADYVVVTVSPRFVGGLRVFGSNELSPYPRLSSWRSERVGDDIVVAGEIVWSSE